MAGNKLENWWVWAMVLLSAGLSLYYIITWLNELVDQDFNLTGMMPVFMLPPCINVAGCVGLFLRRRWGLVPIVGANAFIALIVAMIFVERIQNGTLEPLNIAIVLMIFFSHAGAAAALYLRGARILPIAQSRGNTHE